MRQKYKRKGKFLKSYCLFLIEIHAITYKYLLCKFIESFCVKKIRSHVVTYALVFLGFFGLFVLVFF